MVRLLALFALSIALAQGRAEPEIVLIPAGYVGEVTIAFRAANGEPPAIEDDARFYQIPANGILLTQSGPNEGMGPVWRFFSVGANGHRVPIPRIWASTVPDTPENRAHPDVEIFYPRRGRLQGSGLLPCDIEYNQYFVGTRAQLLDRDPDADRRRVNEYLRTSFKCQ